MIYSVEISEQAENDLRNIYEYIHTFLQLPDNASRQLSKLEKAIYKLDYMPERYQLYQKEPWFSRGLRKMPVEHYNVFYVVQEDKRKVVIIRILYFRQNDYRILFENDESGLIMEEKNLHYGGPQEPTTVRP